jgi:hypothetical protein
VKAAWTTRGEALSETLMASPSIAEPQSEALTAVRSIAEPLTADD